MPWPRTLKAHLLLPVLALFTFGGCFHHHHYDSRPPKSKKSKMSSKKRCHPSHYWDGTECKHKGKGKGARKHDGR
ncbi:hypothetical protein [Corallococcus macrosporus]|uniref:Lipoprotein n=2 Tax=Myxococcaceae TaxID=31 RepID=A0A250K4Y7_9BACT|nr:hypothetical protein [Corallococcus macrosporus]AEI64878.1 hypothetical protein LILAB_14865 [Corallococcus macrosporus]ATB50396.1 hypothetical protein MYMAC_006052 [Corallococcus macrosporus DSM 14697]